MANPRGVGGVEHAAPDGAGERLALGDGMGAQATGRLTGAPVGRHNYYLELGEPQAQLVNLGAQLLVLHLQLADLLIA